MKFSAVAGKRAGSASPLDCQTSTQARNDGFGFPRRARLTRGQEIQHVIREGKRIRTVYLDVRFTASPLGISRIGIVVPRHQQSAVDRNRLKRRIRELVRLELLPALPTLSTTDVAVRARREAYGAPLAALRDDINTIAAALRTLAADMPNARA